MGDDNGQSTAVATREARTPEKVSQGFGLTTLERSNEMASVAVAASAKAEVEAAYIMALKQPRKEEDARVKIIAICKNPSFAAKSRYSKPVGGTAIEGPSIRLAEEILRHWGNVLIQQTAIYDDDTKRIVKVTVRDLESNLSYSKELTVEKHVERKNPAGREVLGERPNTTGSRVFIVKATEDELQNKEAALVSKAIRNSGLRLIPEHIIEEAMRTAKETMAAKVQQDPEAEKKAVLDAFAAIGVLPSAIEIYLQHPLAQITAQELLDLRDILTAITDGQTTWTDYVSPDGTVKATAQPDGKTSTLKEALKTQAAEPPPPPPPAAPARSGAEYARNKAEEAGKNERTVAGFIGGFAPYQGARAMMKGVRPGTFDVETEDGQIALANVCYFDPAFNEELKQPGPLMITYSAELYNGQTQYKLLKIEALA